MRTQRPRWASRRVSATTLLEVLIGAVLLGLICVPVGLLLQTSSRQIRSSDLSREVRSMMERVMQRVESTDLTVLYDCYGVDPNASGRMSGQLAEFSPGAKSGRNPLLLDEPLLGRIAALGLVCDLQFRFMSSKELGIDPSNPLKSDSGLLHLQAGVSTLKFKGKLEGRPFEEEVRKPVYCPMILGRPGLVLSQCPAVNPVLVKRFENIP